MLSALRGGGRLGRRGRRASYSAGTQLPLLARSLQASDVENDLLGHVACVSHALLRGQLAARTRGGLVRVFIALIFGLGFVGLRR